ncbi:hypothetical protein WSM22_25560 [Cytophagales bacterium WSM2-2]|nr:hypothetical protein WSM22_25560 [Cytophagales bacterium WSM2-2]
MDNAIRFTTKANQTGLMAQYAIQPTRKLYYVYILSTEDRKKAYNLLIKIKVETNYKDAWVFTGLLGNDQAVVVPEVKKEEPKVEPVKKDSVKTVKVEPPKTDSAAQKKAEPVVTAKPKGKPFSFHLVNAEGKELAGHVQLQETIGATQFRDFKSGEIVYLEAPVNKKGAYSITTQIPGYKEQVLSFIYTSPPGEKGSQDENIITFTLEKAKKGDYIDFNNVHFFKNASIMQQGSQDELDGLVNLLKENPKYEIKIYGYCNGKQVRESYTMGTSTKFFAMDPAGNKKETITSKALSLARAETVKAYLVQQGIDASRITTKGEGGSVPLYPEGGTLGQYNDRVEVAFIKH